jgi:hypothetical protein
MKGGYFDTMVTVPMLFEQQLQDDRKARAQHALRSGAMSVTPMAVGWLVASRGKRYTVAMDEGAWRCTCPDFSGRCQRFGLRCKHIEAVRLVSLHSSSGAPAHDHPPDTQSTFIPNHMEAHMTFPNSAPTPAGSAPPTGHTPGTDELLWRLRQPLDMSRVKRRQAPGQGTVPYLEGYDVIEAANDLFMFRWSFDLLSEPRIMRWDKTVTIYDQQARKKVPILGDDGQPVTEIAGVAYITGRITVELDGQPYHHADVGRCTFTGDSPEALDMAIAGAATDCLKRCFRQMGEQFGNSLYDKEVARTAGLEQGSAPGNGRSARPRREPAPPPETKAYRDGAVVDKSNAAEVEAFDAFQSAHQGLAPATRQALRSWAASRNGT